MEEKQEEALIKVVAYHHAIVHKYNKKVQEREFKISSFVLGSMFDNTRNPKDGKLGLNWEGSYQGCDEISLSVYRSQTS